ncbi:hypothetical protein CcI49_12835 [Frankia sp. CcI49]|uniref:hypothetical protein n=1 Tax=Frankia sp. R43 TaxID=269536 RepID=UPI0006CA00DE|nr:hypothetical protein [Frankia sp. R43]KPM57169.1 hypothetical protein ACG83_05255 [Frankia sp. R43]ONH60256.1 hypothetical protein CcI49_12835 [Frankia sp. CcI49]
MGLSVRPRIGRRLTIQPSGNVRRGPGRAVSCDSGVSSDSGVGGVSDGRGVGDGSIRGDSGIRGDSRAGGISRDRGAGRRGGVSGGSGGSAGRFTLLTESDTAAYAERSSPHQVQQNDGQTDHREKKQDEKRYEGDTHGCSSRFCSRL